MIELHNDDCRNVKIEDRGKYCIVTDPPFNIGYKYRSYKDKMREDEYFDLLQKTLTGGRSVLSIIQKAYINLPLELGNRQTGWLHGAITATQSDSTGILHFLVFNPIFH